MQEQSTTHHNRDSTLDSLPHFMSTTLTDSTLFSVADQVTSVIDQSKHPYVTLTPPPLPLPLSANTRLKSKNK